VQKAPLHVRLRNAGLTQDAIAGLLELVEDEDARDEVRDWLNPPPPAPTDADKE
jgi:hypothetical protein